MRFVVCSVVSGLVCCLLLCVGELLLVVCNYSWYVGSYLLVVVSDDLPVACCSLFLCCCLLCVIG